MSKTTKNTLNAEELKHVQGGGNSVNTSATYTIPSHRLRCGSYCGGGGIVVNAYSIDDGSVYVKCTHCIHTWSVNADGSLSTYSRQ